MKKNLIVSLVVLTACVGCAVFHQPVPESKFSGTIGGQKFSLVSPKNTSLTNLNITVNTNGSASLSIGYLQSNNDSNIVAGAYAGAAGIVTATGEATAKSFEAGAKAAGGAFGAAVK